VATGIRGARFVTLPGSNHMPWMDDDDVMRTARAFFLGEEDGAERGPTGTGIATDADAGEADPLTGVALDRDRRCVVLDGEDVRLTPLEFGVLSTLVDAEGAVVTRDTLLATVWQQPFEGSNKVDVLVRALRRKLGPWAASVETVIGHGFRFAGWQR
jgi:DNA-binding response OmpR family regulator